MDDNANMIDECRDLGQASIETQGASGAMIEPSAIGRLNALTDD